MALQLLLRLCHHPGQLFHLAAPLLQAPFQRFQVSSGSRSAGGPGWAQQAADVLLQVASCMLEGGSHTTGGVLQPRVLWL
jgi:hypothetical protein